MESFLHTMNGFGVELNSLMAFSPFEGVFSADEPWCIRERDKILYWIQFHYAPPIIHPTTGWLIASRANLDTLERGFASILISSILILARRGAGKKKNQSPFLLKFTSCTTRVFISEDEGGVKISPRLVISGLKKSNEGTTTLGFVCFYSARGR